MFKKPLKYLAVATAGLMLSLTVASAAVQNGVFKDTENHWAKDAIKYVVDKGYMIGYPDGTFKPDSTLTRAELAQIIQRMEKGGVTVPEVPTNPTNPTNPTTPVDPKPTDPVEEVPTKMTVEEIVNKTIGAVVRVESLNGAVHGTGFIFKDNYIITAAHVTSDMGQNKVVLYDDKYAKHIANVVAVHPNADLAILKLETKRKDLPTIKLSNLTDPVGQKVFTIGHPGTAKWEVSQQGVVDRNFVANRYYEFAIAGMPVKGGNSGGPVLNEYGEAIGIAIRAYSKTDATSTLALKEWIEQNAK